jgi:hypothetical protein
MWRSSCNGDNGSNARISTRALAYLVRASRMFLFQWTMDGLEAAANIL